MRAYGHSALDEKARGVSHELAAFEHYDLCAGGHQSRGAAHRLLTALLIAAEGHVGDVRGSALRARDTLAVMDLCSRVTGSVVLCPCTTLPSESPTRITSTSARPHSAVKLAS